MAIRDELKRSVERKLNELRGRCAVVSDNLCRDVNQSLHELIDIIITGSSEEVALMVYYVSGLTMPDVRAPVGHTVYDKYRAKAGAK